MNFYIKNTVCLGIIMVSTNAFALASDVKQPVKLVADSASYNQKKGVTEYLGNVEISQGTLKITADKLTIYLNKSGGIQKAEAFGSPSTMQQQVSAKKGIAKGKAKKINYNASTGIINLSGNAHLSQNGTSISGDDIRYSLKLGDFEAKRGKSNKRVTLIIPASDSINLKSIKQ